jgi:hypothetical protein
MAGRWSVEPAVTRYSATSVIDRVEMQIEHMLAGGSPGA